MLQTVLTTFILSLFVFKRNRNNKGPDDFDIQRVFPIFGNFSISMAQMTRETLDLSTSKSNVDQLRSGGALYSVELAPTSDLTRSIYCSRSFDSQDSG